MTGVSTTLRRTIFIAAPRSVVWRVLVDTADYPDWNPYYVQVTGEVATGVRLRMRVSMDSSDARVTASPRVLRVEPMERIVWRNRVLIPGLLTATHSFLLHRDAAGTVLEQEETFAGLLLPVSAGAIGKVGAKLDELGAALRARSESRA